LLCLLTISAHSQCPKTFDFYGLPSANPYWYSCSGSDYTLNLQSPNNWGSYTIDWGDGSPQSTGNFWNSPSIITHVYTATVDTFVVVVTEVNSGCQVQGVMVMEESTSASIQIPVGGITQTCAPRTLEFINSSTNVSETTIFTWDFGDGSPPQTFNFNNLGNSVSHLYEPETVDCETEVSLSAQNYCNTIQGGPSVATFSPIRIWDVDEAVITPSSTISCYPDTIISFSNTSQRNCLLQGNVAQRYERWNFGDYWGKGYDSIADWSPWPPAFPQTIAFPGYGDYSVMLLDSNFCGIDTATISVSIIPPPTAGISASKDTVCVGEPITFFNQHGGGANQFFWNFANGLGFIPTGGGNITFVYNLPGTYLVQSIASIANSGGSCADTASVEITVLPAPNAIISADNFDGCDQLTVNFAENSTGNAVSWFWDFGNNNTFNGNSPPPQEYLSPGIYVITLEIENEQGCTDTDQETVKVYSSPNVAFLAQNVCEGAESQFTDLSTFDPGDPIISWNWNFGDGNSSALQNPIHTYQETGSFIVSLSVQTPQCGAQQTSPISVEPAPVPNFSLNTSGGCSPLVVDFANNTSGAASYAWTFGDGAGSTEENPTHTFINSEQSDATYTAILTAFTDSGCGRKDSIQITVEPGATSSFTDNSIPPACSPFSAEFQNNSTAAISYMWLFGDGSTSSDVNPTHIYTNNTPFLQTLSVDLIAFAANGCHDTTSSNIIVYPEPNVDFAVFPSSGCAPLSINLPFIQGIASFQWDFGDGTTSNAAVPEHTYENTGNQTETYTITLLGISPFGCVDSASDIIEVDPQPTAAFTASVLSGCSPLQVNFSNLSASASGYNWEYGDGLSSTNANAVHSHTFSNTSGSVQTYTVVLTALSPQGCSDTFEIDITVYPEVVANFTGPNQACASQSIELFNNSTSGAQSLWDFGNDITSTQTFPTPVYASSESGDTTYVITLNVTSQYGCFNEYSSQITVYNAPTAQFITANFSGCQPVSVDITNQSQGASVYNWQYGDGTSSTTSALLHVHEYNSISTNSEQFILTLIAENLVGCSDTASQAIIVYPLVESSVVGEYQGCSPFNAYFLSASQGASSSLTWDFGDGTSASGSSVNHVFINSSAEDTVFTITHYAENIFGCIDSSFTTVLVNATPIADIEVQQTQGCYPLEVTFLNNTIGADEYAWFYGTGQTSSNSETVHTQTFYNTAVTPVTYTVTMTASSDGCSDSDQTQITVFPALEAEFEGPANGCGPLQITFNNQSIGANDYYWDFGDGTTQTISEPIHTFNNLGEEDIVYTVSLTAFSPFGCEDTYTQNITVFPTPNAAFSASPVSQIFPDATIILSNNSTGGNSLSYTWDMDDGSVLNGENPGNYTYSTWGSYAIELFITNGACSDETIQTIQIDPPAPIANFNFNGEGCAPLTVVFDNLSIYGQNYLWQFGDGSSSSVENPAYSYEQGGLYTVTLTVFGFDGTTSTYQLTVEVWPSAEAAFTVSPDQVAVPGQPFQTINLSQNANEYLWDFGDGTTSTEPEPEHSYQTSGAYTITLIAYNELGCTDTFTVAGAVNAIDAGYLEFPNAFTPIDGGPYGGQYESNQLNNDVFFPVHRGVKEYLFQVYNKWGELLFETDDIGTGWDGYYRGSLCRQDVYAWKARAKFSSGKEIEIAGDVTLLR